MAMALAQRVVLVAIVRAIVAVAGGYAATALGVMGLAVCLVRWGMIRSDAVVVAAMLGFPAYLAVLMWALACTSLRRLAAGLGIWTVTFALLVWLAGAGPSV